MPVEAAALGYVGAGLSVIPTRPGDKRPSIPWKEYQKRRATDTEVRTWYTRQPDAGVAIVCGAVSRVVVVDGDPRNGDGLTELTSRLPKTPTAETGGGGCHFYFGVTSNQYIPKVASLLPGVDLQAEGSYVMAPPSHHPSGRCYRWLRQLALGEVALAPLPPILRHLLALHQQERESSRKTGRNGSGPRPTLGAVFGHLRGVRRMGSGWLARCPAHDDREPSLSVGEGHGGRLLLHCFAGCRFTDVVHALYAKRPGT